MMLDVFLYFLFIVDIALFQKCGVNVLDVSIYIGCFVDTDDRLLPNITMLGSSADNNRCILLCRDFGYMYAGTQCYEECHCGNDPWRYTAADVDPKYIQDFDCNRPCHADSSQMCGGGWRLSVYSTGVNIDTLLTYHRRSVKIGLDKKINDSMTAISSQNVMSPIHCAALCSNNEDCNCFVYSTITKLCQLYWLKYQDLCDYTFNEEGSSVYIVY